MPSHEKSTLKLVCQNLFDRGRPQIRTDVGFDGVTQEDSLFGDKSFSEIFAMLGAEPGKRYEIEICIEEC